MMKKIIIILSFFILNFIHLRADLIWSRETGWRAEGGILELAIGNTPRARSALEAMNLAAQAQENKDYRVAISLYNQVYDTSPNSLLAPEALYQIALIRMERCEYQRAFIIFEKIITDYPNYPKFDKIIEMQFKIASQLQSGSRPYYCVIPGFSIPWFRDYNSAMKFFDSIVSNAPYSRYAPSALMNMGILAEQCDKIPDAIDAFDRLISEYPDSSLAPEAYLKLARIYMCMAQGPDYDQGATIEAINHYDDFLFLYPNNPDVKEAEEGLACARDSQAENKLIMGDFYYQTRNNPKAARIFYNEAISIAPHSCTADLARQRLECIDNGLLADPCIVDVIFGRYERPCEPPYLEREDPIKSSGEKTCWSLFSRFRKKQPPTPSKEEVPSTNQTPANAAEGASVAPTPFTLSQDNDDLFVNTIADDEFPAPKNSLNKSSSDPSTMGDRLKTLREG